MTYTKCCWNEIASSIGRNFTINDQFYLNFSDVKDFYLYFWVILRLVFELSYFTRKKPVKNKIFSNFKGPPLFFNGWLNGCQFRPILRHLSVLSKKCSFATLVNMRQTLWHLNVKSSLKLNGLWKLCGSFKYSSFSWTL